MSKKLVSSGQTIAGDVFLPSTGSTWPSVVIAYGTLGMSPPFDTLIKDFGNELAASGFLVFVPDYFSATGTPPTFKSVYASPPKTFDRWVEILTDAVPYVQDLANDLGKRSALVGFSLGANLALRAAAGPRVKAVVDFFGPMTTTGSSIGKSLVAKLPPTLIHHGAKDAIVRCAESDQLEKWLVDLTIPYTYPKTDYLGDGHAGQSLIPGLGPVDWSPTAQRKSSRSTIDFLTKWL